MISVVLLEEASDADDRQRTDKIRAVLRHREQEAVVSGLCGFDRPAGDLVLC